MSKQLYNLDLPLFGFKTNKFKIENTHILKHGVKDIISHQHQLAHQSHLISAKTYAAHARLTHASQEW